MMLRADLAQQDLELGTRCTGQVCRTPGGMVAHTAAIEVVAPLRPQENTSTGAAARHRWHLHSPCTTDPGRTRTYNPRLRGPMPYPLGHGATCKSLQLCTHSTLLLTRKDLVAELSA